MEKRYLFTHYTGLNIYTDTVYEIEVINPRDHIYEEIQRNGNLIRFEKIGKNVSSADVDLDFIYVKTNHITLMNLILDLIYMVLMYVYLI